MRLGRAERWARGGLGGFLVVALAVVATAASPDGRLVEAVRAGDAEAVDRLLSEGADVEEAAADGTTGLLWAAYRDDVPVARRLLAAGADPEAANRYGETPLLAAAASGDAALVGLLLDAGADARAATPAGETALMRAARTGRPEPVRLLLDRGAEPNAREEWRGQTALMWAAAEGHAGAVEVLLKGGADIAARSKRGFTALLFAVRQGNTPVVQRLLAAGAEVDEALPGNGESRGPGALDLAVANAHYELAALLLEAGAHPDGMQPGRTPLHTITWVRKPGRGSNDPAPPGSGALDSLELVRRLVRHGADLDARMTNRRGGPRTALNLRGATPFLLAARTADAPLMRLLAELGADPRLPNEDGTTPLMVAAGVGVQSPGEDPGTEPEVYEAVQLALELGADINAVDDRGETAMHGAAYKHVPSVVRLLAERGADVDLWNRKNHSGWTPLRIAVGVHRTMNFRSSPETAAAIREAMRAAGVAVPEVDEDPAVAPPR